MPTGTMRCLLPLPTTRTTPIFISSSDTRTRHSSETRRPVAYRNSSMARSRRPCGLELVAGCQQIVDLLLIKVFRKTLPLPWRGQMSGWIGVHRAFLDQMGIKIAKRRNVPGDGSAGHAALYKAHPHSGVPVRGWLARRLGGATQQTVSNQHDTLQSWFSTAPSRCGKNRERTRYGPRSRQRIAFCQ